MRAILAPIRRVRRGLIPALAPALEITALDARNIISSIADAMTIFGVGGFFTWSFVKRSITERDVADVGVSIFSWSVKLFLCLAALAALFIPAMLVRIFVIMVISGSYSPGEWLWSKHEPLAYSISYFVSALLFIPLGILTASSVFSWSLAPFRKFWLRLSGRG